MGFPRLWMIEIDLDGESFFDNRVFRTKAEATRAVETYISELERKHGSVEAEDAKVGKRLSFIDNLGLRHFGLMEICPI